MTTESLHNQFLLAKSRHPDKIVLLKETSGKNYWSFGSDALIVARASGVPDTIAVHKLPAVLLESTLHHLLRAGEQVALCEQKEDS